MESGRKGLIFNYLIVMVYILNIEGYFRDAVRDRFPDEAGIYFVYRGSLDPVRQWATLKELLYIGETGDMHMRHNNHDKRRDFLNQLGSGEMLFYTFALTDYSEQERKRIEAALIHELMPPLNNQATVEFNYPQTRIEIQGDRHAFVPNIVDAPSY